MVVQDLLQFGRMDSADVVCGECSTNVHDDHYQTNRKSPAWHQEYIRDLLSTLDGTQAFSFDLGN